MFILFVNGEGLGEGLIREEVILVEVEDHRQGPLIVLVIGGE